MGAPSLTYTLTNNTTADATQVMQNFNDLLNGVTDGSKDLAVSALTVAGNFSATGTTLALGNSSTDTLSITASLGATLLLTTNTSFDLGSAGLGLASVYLGAATTKTCRVVAASFAANGTYTIPDVGATGTFVLLEGAQDVTGLKVFQGGAGIVGGLGADANTALTKASNRIQVVTTSVARTYTLPTTGIKKYERITIENIGAFDLSIKSSDATTMTYANAATGSIGDPTIQIGFVTLEATQDTPTASTHWRVIDVEEDYASYTKALGGALNTSTATIKLFRKGKFVHGRMSSGTQTSVNVTFATLAAASFPSRFCVASGGSNQSPMVIYWGGVEIVGYITVLTDGSANIAKYDSTGWTVTTAGITQGSGYFTNFGWYLFQ